MTNQRVISYMVDYRPHVCCYLSLFSIKTSDRAFTPLFNKIIISVPKSTTYLRSVAHSNICICIFPEVLWRHIPRSVGILYDLDVIGTHPLHSSSQMLAALEALLLSEGREGKRTPRNRSTGTYILVFMFPICVFICKPSISSAAPVSKIPSKVLAARSH